MEKYFDAPSRERMGKFTNEEIARVALLARRFPDPNRATNLLYHVRARLLHVTPPQSRRNYLGNLTTIQRTVEPYEDDSLSALGLYENALAGAYELTSHGQRVRILTPRPVGEIIGTVRNTVAAMNPSFRSLVQFQKLLHNAFDSDQSESRGSSSNGHKVVHIRGSRPGETVVVGRDISSRRAYGFI